ncbi:hypothetical protein [Halobaculum sp. MBLA0143]|uniref:hypothetical protein n=1 Tax=Halobaculum sp. MBLA0143 TaxID=3079933 RepID=UPI00352688ED
MSDRAGRPTETVGGSHPDASRENRLPFETGERGRETSHERKTASAGRPVTAETTHERPHDRVEVVR